jgi:uncharacterized protein (TIGR00304 family)
MRESATFWTGLALLIAGAVLIALAVRHGDVHVVLILIIPTIYGTSGYLALGALLIFVGFFLLLIGYFESVTVSMAGGDMVGSTSQPLSPGASGQPGENGSAPQKAAYGGFLLIGPFPVVFGNRAGWFPYLVVLAIVTAIAFIVFALLILLR